MNSQLRNYLQRLDLAEYINVLQENGYESWMGLETIRERDFDYLGFKLGHRRRLQRQIATMNGYPHSKALSFDNMKVTQDQSRLNRRRKQWRKFLLQTNIYRANGASTQLSSLQYYQNTNPAIEYPHQRRQSSRRGPLR